VSSVRFRRPDLALGAVPLLLAYLLTGSAAATSLSQPIVVCKLPVSEAPEGPLADGHLPADYGRGASLELVEPDGSVVKLSQGFASACDPDVSFDGQRVLFAGQKSPDDPWNIWEIGIDGSGLRQITYETLDSRQPIYLSTLYTITSTEPWYTILFVRRDGVMNETVSAEGSSLYSVRLDGSELRRISFHPGNDRTPFLMQDGLVIFAGTRLSPGHGSGQVRTGLFGIQTDGIDYSDFGGSQGLRIQHMPTVTADGQVVFVEADSVGWDGAGRLAALDIRRPLYSYRSLTGIAAGLFHSPSPLEVGSVLVSHRSGDDGELGLVSYTVASGTIEEIRRESGFHLLHAKAVRARPEPDGRSSTVRPESPTGKLYCLDVYESDPAFANLERGSAKRLRVLEAVPEATADAASAGRAWTGELGVSPIAKRLLGEAPIEEDGSFHIDVPADLPVQLQVLDADGLALATCDWIWVKPREYRGCIGCHEDPELTPSNRFVQAAGRPATQLTLPPERRREVSFERQIAPLLAARCQSCHQSGGTDPVLGPEAGAADAPQVYSALVAPAGGYVDPGSARTSPLVWRLLGRDTSISQERDERAAESLPQDHVGLLSPEEMQVLIEWIDMGAQRQPHRRGSTATADGAMP
jgi:hypothetical protein